MKKEINTEPAGKLPEFKNTDERNEALNKDAGKKLVWDSIDRPIRPLVLELNRIGLCTSFSCCGYSYVGEEEPKSHSKWANVLFYNTNEEDHKALLEMINHTEWTVYLMENKRELCLVFRYTPICWSNCDNLQEAIHDYECKLDAIVELTSRLKKIPTACDNSVLRDGNESRKNFYGKEWMIEPKQPVTIVWTKIEEPK
jgi:hypothetical protein